MFALLLVFVTLLRSTLGSTKPETVKASKTKPVLWEEVQGVDAAKDELMDVTAWLKRPGPLRGARRPGRRAASSSSARPGPARRCSPAPSPPRPASTSSPPRARASSRCSSAAAPPGSAGSSRRRASPGRAVIFIDELDAIGGARSGGGGDGGTSEREQALNQLLVELDGFERDPGTVIVIAASNHVDKLDKALLRRYVLLLDFSLRIACCSSCIPSRAPGD